jgi:Lrp/AsnC family leucine-responsive transcriptional regulator
MDKKDNKIVFELTRNAKLSNKQLAKKIRLSESSTIYRLNNLYKNKVILGTHAIVDFSKLGYQAYRFYFNFQNTTTKEETEIRDWLINNKSTDVVGVCSGDINIACINWLKSAKEIDELVKSLREKYGKYIKDFEPTYYLKTYFFNRNYLVDNKDRNYFSTGSNDVVEYDNIDYKILEVLSKDARLSKREISLKINVPLRTITYRISNLEKNKVIMGYSINLNYDKVGIEYYKIGFVLSNNVKFDDLISFAANLDNTIFVDYCYSRFYFELNVEVKNYSELESIINIAKDKFGGISDLFVFRVKQYYKFEFF